MRALPSILFLVLVSTSAAAQIPEFIVDALPELPGGNSGASRVAYVGLDDLAAWVVAGSSTNQLGVQRPGVWTFTDASDLAFLTLPPLDPTKNSWANAARGVYAPPDIGYRVVGVSIDSSDHMQPVVWSLTSADTEYSAPEVLPTLAGGTGSALSYIFSLDTLGIVGSSNDGSADKAVYWEVPLPGTPTVTPLPGDDPSSVGSATSVGPMGPRTAVCGWSTDAQGDTIPRFWKSSDGGATWTMKQLPLLPGGDWGRANRLVTGDSIWCWVAGTARTAGGARRAVLWETADAGDNWSITPLFPANGLPGSESFGGTTVDDLGIRATAPNLATGASPARPLFVVGRSYGPGAEVATLWVVNLTETIAYDLNTLVTGMSPYVLRSATGARMGPHDGTLTLCGVGTDFAARRVATSAVPPAGAHAWIARSTTPTGVRPHPTPPRGLFVSASPNPFSDNVSVTYELPGTNAYRLGVYDASGRRVAVLARGRLDSGAYTTDWDGRGSDGRPVPAGVYFVRLEAAGEVGAAKVVLIR